MKHSLKTRLILIGAIVLIAGAGAYLVLRRTGVAGTGGNGTGRRAFRTGDMADKMAAAQAVLAYLRAPGAGTLEEALRACLSTAERNPEDTLNNFLLAFCYHEMKDSAAEARVLSKCRPEQRDMYRFSFYDHRADLADALYYMPAYICAKQREAHNAGKYYPPGAKCPFFGGPVTSREYRRGNRTITRFICPTCDGMIQLKENTFMGNMVEHRVKKENPLVSILTHIAVLHEDRRRSWTDTPDTVPMIVSALGIREGMVIGDIGSSLGQFSFPLAEKVGPKGKVYAEDIDEGLVRLLKYCVEKGGVKNVVPLLGTPTDMKFPSGALDMAVLIHVYRSIVLVMDEQGPEQMNVFFDGFFAAVHKALKKDGVLVLVDHFDPQLDLSADTVVGSLKKRNFLLVEERPAERGRNFIFIFRKTEPAAQPSR